MSFRKKITGLEGYSFEYDSDAVERLAVWTDLARIRPIDSGIICQEVAQYCYTVTHPKKGIWYMAEFKMDRGFFRTRADVAMVQPWDDSMKIYTSHDDISNDRMDNLALGVLEKAIDYKRTFEILKIGMVEATFYERGK